MVLFGLDIHPGSVVVESGTGTGSLSHALLRAIQPHGHLYTYEFNKHRVDAVRYVLLSFPAMQIGVRKEILLCTFTERSLCAIE